MSDPITTDAGAQDAPQQQPQTPSAPDAPKTFDAAYVEDLRKEAAKYRTELRKLQAAAEQAETAKLGDLEKAQKRAAELEAAHAQATAALRTERARAAVMAAAGQFNLPPTAAARLVTPDALEYDDDGQPKVSSVRAALKSLADELPELTVQARSANPARGVPAAETDEQRRARIFGGGVNPFDPTTAARLGGGVVWNNKD